MNIKHRILEQASEMFFSQGIRTITMDEIADSLGMSKRTLYECFATKEDLLQGCIGFKYDEGLQFREQIENEHSGDPLEILYQHFRYALMNLNTIHQNFTNDLQKFHSTLWDKHVKSKQYENIVYTQSLLDRGIENGLFRSEANTEILSVMIHSAMPLMISGAVFPKTRFSHSEVFQQVFMNFIRGMATKEGLVLIDEKFSQNN